VCCHSQRQARQVKDDLARWLAPRGLAFNEDKTRIVHLTEGFDFLGFNVRRYSNGKLLIKPSTAAVKRIRERLAAEIRALRGGNAAMVIARLSPITRGWAAYYRGVVSSEIFSSLDHYAWKLLYKWAKRSHPNKSKRWVVRRYFGKFNKFRNDRWVFGAHDLLDRHGRPLYLVKFSWTNIVRHQVVTGRASPDDPDLIDYWASRRRRVTPPLDSYNLRLLTKQKGRCPLCGDHLLTADQPPQSPPEWERWWLGTVRRAITVDYLTHQGHGGPDGDRTRLIHTSCSQRLHAQRRKGNPRQPATPSRLA
jgi:RNA-directed DNA polymerase